MGVLSDMREVASKRHDNVVSLIAEDKERSAVLFRENTIHRGARLFDETYSRYTGLGQMLESNDPREQYKAALTLEMLAKVENYIENAKQMYGEATVQGSLGALTPRVLDVVRIFYPNQILTTLADVQPLDGAALDFNVRRLGNPSVTKTFHVLRDAQAWARHMEVQADRRDLPLDSRALQQVTLGELTVRYQDTITVTKRGHRDERIVLNAFLLHPICRKRLSEVSGADLTNAFAKSNRLL
jgi:hypothetical protein